MPDRDFHKNVFINCPFDDEYKPILEAILFCLIRLGFNPRIATERDDGGENRLDKIRDLILCSKYSIHDLSRCIPSNLGEFSRGNMPFELGLDFGCRRFGGSPFDQKGILILEEKQYSYQKFISDISGNDIHAHNNDYVIAIRKVRNWIRVFDKFEHLAADRVSREYDEFKWKHFKKLMSRGYSRADIDDSPTIELMDAMKRWCSKFS